VLVAFSQHKYNKTNQRILLYVYEFNQYKCHKTRYTRKAQNSERVDMPRDLQMLLSDVAFLTLLMQRLGQLCSTRGPVESFVRPIRFSL